MATITLSMGKEYELAKKRFPDVNWNEIIKQFLIKKIEEIKKFEKLKTEGKI